MPKKLKFVSRAAWLPALALVVRADPALAHHVVDGQTPRTFTEGLLSGLAHPILGLDHLLFLLLAGILACGLASQGRYRVPGVFVVSALLGTAMHLTINVPLAELVVVLSVIVGGTAIVTQRRVTAMRLSLFLAVAGLVHGYAYGESIVGAQSEALFAYLVGLSVVHYVVIVGMATLAGQLTARLSTVRQRSLKRERRVHEEGLSQRVPG